MQRPRRILQCCLSLLCYLSVVTRSSTAFQLVLTSATLRFRSSSTSIMSATENVDTIEWRPVMEWIDAKPDDLVSHSPQMAKDIQYAQTIQTAWKEEICQRTNRETSPMASVVATEWTRVSYATEDMGNGADALHGYCLRRTLGQAHFVAGIVLFHTGAGPHDIFLLWKAESLLQELQDSVGYVFVADILSDEEGWAWSPDRARYDQVRSKLFQKQDGRRMALQQRVSGALNVLYRFPQVDRQRIGALGWCLGGQPIWELAKIVPTATPSTTMAEDPNLLKIRCMVTFHGVCDGAFDGAPAICSKDQSRFSKRSSILICNGAQDPFVPTADLTHCIQMLRQYGYQVRLLEFPNARHGFTNPAQALNPNPAFDFDREAANEAWQQTILLLRENLSGMY